MRYLILIALFLAACGSPEPSTTVAQRLLDDGMSEEDRVRLAREHASDAPVILAELTDGMAAGTEEEYRCIPWIWRITREAGETNDAEVIRSVLEGSLPADGEPMHDWQVVVLGGGIVSGLSAAGEWPRERVHDILASHPDLMRRWERSVALAADVADNHDVPDPTRYDALRMVAAAGWEDGSPQLIRYLESAEDELQMGAVSGLSDIDAPDVDSVLVRHFDAYSEYNRGLALLALLRTDDRAQTLRGAVEAGDVAVDSVHAEQLRTHPSPEIRTRAHVVLGEPAP